MATIHLIRHGQASTGKDDYDQLSELGFEQANRLGEVISQRLSFDKVIVGGMRRHKQTAQACLAHFDNFDFGENEVLGFDAGWNEYDHQDILRQYSADFHNAASTNAFLSKQTNPQQVFEDSFNASIRRWQDGQYNQDYVETWADFQARVSGALDQAVSTARDGNDVAVFTSGGPISFVCQRIFALPATQLMQFNWTLLNCGVTKLVVTKRRVFIASLNEHSHFEHASYKRFLSYA